MKIATLLFTYNRSYHTEQVLTSLMKNTELPSKLFVFQDGVKQDENICEWQKVNNLIQAIDWCEREIIVATHNRGLAEAIVSGINYAFKEYEAVIVLEDDCVPTVNFMSFMRQCFEKYQDNKMVYSISGYSYPFALRKDQNDVYGCGRISSWGWGTWKDRWSIYKKDYEIARKMKQEEMTSRNLAMWGRDLEDMLVGNIRGSCNSWAVFWALNVIFQNGICINPYESLIKNIGLDGSGVHCGVTDKFNVKIENKERKEFCLPDHIEFLDETIKAFIPFFGSYTAAGKEDKAKKNIIIYGVGGFFFQNEKAINENYNIIAVIDKGKSGWFAGKKIIKINEIEHYTYDRILVMIQDIQECINVVRALLMQGISHKQILFGHSFYENCYKRVKEITALPNGNLTITIGNILKEISSKDDLDILEE